jgi:hypothetical protein
MNHFAVVENQATVLRKVLIQFMKISVLNLAVMVYQQFGLVAFSQWEKRDAFFR